MLLMLLYIALTALVIWSVAYLVWRVVRSFRGKGGCSCGCGGSGGCGCGCDSCESRETCRK